MTSGPVEALKIALRQEGDGIMITFRIQPEDLPKELLCARIMSRWALAAVEIDSNEQPVHPVEKAVDKKKKQNANVMRAAMACKERGFHNFLKQKHAGKWKEVFGTDEQKSSAIVRYIADVDSRRTLATDPEALKRFDRLMSDYEMWKRGE